MSIFGPGNIKNNKIVATHNQSVIADMVDETFRQHQLVHDGLLFSMKRYDPNWQLWMNMCDEYPMFLSFGDVAKMDVIFEAMHKHIMDKFYSSEHPPECDCKPNAMCGCVVCNTELEGYEMRF